MNKPYDENNMTQAIDYAKVIKQLFQMGMKQAAYEMYLKDPNGTGASFELFNEVMEKVVNK